MVPNLHIAWPIVLLIIPLPFLIRYVLPPLSNSQDAIWLPYLDDFQRLSDPIKNKTINWPLILSILIWLLLIFAASRPQWVIEAEGQPISGRDLVVAVDLSESMRQTDFELDDGIINRLEASKLVAKDFISKREGDRIGLIVFGTQAYIQTPLTLDRKTVQILLDETSIGLAGSKTAIGDAIGLAVKRLRESDAKERVLILMTDGANTAGEVGPIVAARLAATAGLKIYTIGIGNESEIIREEQSIGPNSYGLDEKTLRHISYLTGGKYYLASDTEELKNIYDEINLLEPVVSEGEQLYLYKELYVWPLGIALLIIIICLRFTRIWS